MSSNWRPIRCWTEQSPPEPSGDRAKTRGVHRRTAMRGRHDPHRSTDREAALACRPGHRRPGARHGNSHGSGRRDTGRDHAHRCSSRHHARGRAAGLAPLHGLEQLQHAGLRRERPGLDQRRPDHRAVRRHAREAAAVRVRVHQHRRYWNGGVDANGRPVPSTTLYPDGLQAVIDHVHANGQKIGLYFIPGISAEVYEAELPIASTPPNARPATS